MEDININELFSEESSTDADKLTGRLRVVSPSQIVEFVRRRMEQTRTEVMKESIGPGEVPAMLDKYMSENADLRARNEANGVRISEYEETLARLEAQGPSADWDIESYVSFDAHEVVSQVENLSESLGALETALNNVEDMEESWVFIEKIAALRSEVNRIVEDTEMAGTAFAGLCEQAPPPANDLVASVCDLKAIHKECLAYGKVIEIMHGILGLE